MYAYIYGKGRLERYYGLMSIEQNVGDKNRGRVCRNKTFHCIFSWHNFDIRMQSLAGKGGVHKLFKTN